MGASQTISGYHLGFGRLGLRDGSLGSGRLRPQWGLGFGSLGFRAFKVWGFPAPGVTLRSVCVCVKS